MRARSRQNSSGKRAPEICVSRTAGASTISAIVTVPDQATQQKGPGFVGIFATLWLYISMVNGFGSIAEKKFEANIPKSCSSAVLIALANCYSNILINHNGANNIINKKEIKGDNSLKRQ